MNKAYFTQINSELKKSRGIIIPHAGKKYAGMCRKSAFQYLPRTNVKKILYISAIHSPGDTDNIYILKKDTGFPKINLQLKKALPEKIKDEHSFKWVEQELRNQFPNVNICCLCPDTKVSIKKLSEELRAKQAFGKLKIIKKFLLKYPKLISKKQTGKGNFNKKRKPKDSKINIKKSIKSQFNLLRVSDNESYPCYFEYKKQKYVLKIYKKNKYDN